jgi:hypothetical protein
MRQRAAALGARIQAEDGVGRAAEFLEELFQEEAGYVKGPGLWEAVRSFVGELLTPVHRRRAS